MTMTISGNRYMLLQQNLKAIERTAEAISLSKAYGRDMNKHLAFVVALELFITGESPLEWSKRNGFVGSTPYTPYDAMIAAFEEAGGVFRLIEKTPDVAKIELTWRGVTKAWSLAWEDAQREPFPYAGKEKDVLEKLAKGQTPALKSKYATPRSRAIMLFARLADDSIRSTAAKVNFGRYAEEIAEEIAIEIDPTIELGSRDDSDQPAQEIPSANPQVNHTQRPPQTVQAPPDESIDRASTQTPPAPDAMPSIQQAIQQLPPDESSTTVHQSVPTEQTDDQSSEAPVQVRLSDPLTPDLRSKIMNQIGLLVQAGDSGIPDRIKARLAQAGLHDLYGLSIAEGEALLAALRNKEIEQWAEQALSGHSSSNGDGPPF